jgi:two-component system, chemotaxis family, chemotaxis protein CheY
MRILIVDDSSIMRAIIKRVVVLAQVPVDEILEAANGAEALRILESRDVQLLLTDINMPVMSGDQLLRELAGDRRWNNLARVVISTDGSACRQEEAARFAVCRYLEKPFTPEIMRDLLAEVARAPYAFAASAMPDPRD